MPRLDKKIFLERAGFSPPEKSRDRWLAIVRAALDSLHDEGIDRTSFETVGRRCRMRRSHIAYYFKSRSDLFEAVFRFITKTAQERVVQEIRATSPPKEQLRALILGHYAWAEREPRQVLVMTLFYFQAIRHPRFAELHREIRTIGTERIRAILQLGLKLRAPEATGLAKNIQALITGNIIDHYSTGGAVPLSLMREYTLSAAETLWEANR